jgi:hypothetical protein
MGPKSIVMIDKYSERSHEVPCVQNQQPVQAFRPNRPNEPLRDPIRLRDLNRRTNNARALRLKDDIETARELSIMVANQESDWVSTLGERPCDMPRLRHPFAVGMRRAAGQVHATTGDFDEEQHVQALEPDGVDGEEIHCNGALCLRAQELTPRRTLALACWTELLLAQDLLVVADTITPRPLSSPTMRR